MLPWAGCTSSTLVPDPADLLHQDVQKLTPAESGVQEFDFGSVLARGQILRHDFTLRNPSDRPVRILKATSSSPCCSSFDHLPRTIPKSREIKVPVIIRTQNKSGLLRIGFSIETDSLATPIRQLGITVRLVPEWEIEDTGSPIRPLSIGKPGKRTYRIVCRRTETDGLGLPDGMIVGTGPLKAAPGPEADETIASGGLIEATREIAVDLLPSPEAGRRQGELFFRWPNGITRSHFISWEVAPRIKASPSGLVLRRSKGPTPLTVIVTSDERPIRILDVDGPLAKPLSLPTDSDRTHRLGLMVETSKAQPGGISDIKITTDHPEQPSVAVTLLFSASAEGG